MPQPDPAYSWKNDSRDEKEEDWRALRDDLVSLLEQVDSRNRRHTHDRDADLPSEDDFSAPEGNRRREALRSVRRAVERHSERSGQDREPALDEHDLSAAIRQIRAEPERADVDVRYPGRANEPGMERAPAWHGLTEAVSGISHRLGRLETAVRSAQSGGGDLSEVTKQLSQLTHVVELLAGAVGETGQVKRLEGQISNIARLIGDGQTRENPALSKRIDELVSSVDRLVEMQTQQASSDAPGETARLIGDALGALESQRDMAQAQTKLMRSQGEAMHAQGDALQSIEAGMQRIHDQISSGLTGAQRNLAEAHQDAASKQQASLASIESVIRGVYDRIDTLENNVAIDPKTIDALTVNVGAILKTLTEGAGKDDGRELAQRIEALSAQVSKLEDDGSEPAIASLKADVSALSDALLRGLNEKFEALEGQIRSLSQQIDGRDGSADLAPIENNIRHLVARMDQTAEEISGFKAMFGETGARALLPGAEEIAELVARRTSEHLGTANAGAAGVSAKSLDALEARLSKLFSGGGSAPDELISGLNDGIARVDERLKRLEDALTGLGAAREVGPAVAGTDTEAAAKPGPTPAPQSAAPAAQKAPDRADEMASLLTSDPNVPMSDTPDADARFPDAAKAAPRQPSTARKDAHRQPWRAEPVPKRPDTLPASPITDAPLVDKGFADIPAAGTAPLPASAGDRAPMTSTGNKLPPPTPQGRDFDPSAIERPAKPASSFDSASFAAAAAELTPEAQARRAMGADASSGMRADRNTFIAAARRAAAQTSTGANAGTNSLIGRAFASIQKRPPGTDAEQVEAPAAPKAGKGPKSESKTKRQDKAAAKAAKKAEKANQKTSLFASLLGRKAKSEAKEDRKEPVADMPAMEAPPHPLPGDPERTAKPAKGRRNFWADRSTSKKPRGGDALAFSAPAAKESFLSRHRQVILLAAAVVAVSLMALNLVNQRMAAQVADQEQPGQGDTPTTAPMLDPEPTGSIDPFVKLDLTQPSANRSALTMQPETTLPATESLAGRSAPLDTFTTQALAPSQEMPEEIGPITLELPDEKIGPVELRQAAADGNAPAQFEVAAIYSEGRIVPQDYQTAVKWYERAAAQGFVPAEYRLGNLYEYGNGVGKDLEEARLWYTRAAEAGNRMAMHNLAALYAGGALGKQQFETGAEWFEKAAERGMTDSQFNLGMLYARGLGVPQDLAKSYKWFSIAARSGDEDAAKARDDVARSLSADVTQAVQAEIAAWQVTPVDIGANFAPLGTWSDHFDPGQTILDKTVIERVQAALERLGFDVGTPDGVLGPRTMEAIRTFESATGMKPLGVVNPRLLAVLGSQPA